MNRVVLSMQALSTSQMLSLHHDKIWKRYSRLRVIRPVRDNGRFYWECICDCGNKKLVRMTDLERGQVKSCGCLLRDMGCSRMLNLVGQRFGRLVAIRFASRENGRTKWRCKCDCGNEVEVSASSLRGGDTQSCGCFRLYSARSKKPVESAKTALYKRYRRDAVARGLEWNLSRKEFFDLAGTHCHYCGQMPSNLHRASIKSETGYIYSGVDRVDNAMGYIDGNVVSCCRTCNMAKRAMSYDEFLSWIYKAANHLGLCDADAKGQ